MEIQSSNSYSQFGNSGRSSNSVPQVEKSSETTSIEQVRSGSQMKRLESQGVAFSAGEEQVIKALDKALKALEGPEKSFEVSVHKETKAIMVKVLNKETGELIREIPSEKTLDLVANMMHIAGILVDEKV
ncbi:flagellar protein FlaG [Paenibacillus typhae]|uniref:Flagellar protein FlaG n=1 Tax=Paenibacillus typhae TaxID=1174501 RepID=A0A1G8NCK5_9BACL|nr:flagellar protein FlaG [Paenibacillus typhae]SDI77883.1 flagellar protein FlaG [Paenibacillus typhae]